MAEHIGVLPDHVVFCSLAAEQVSRAHIALMAVAHHSREVFLLAFRFLVVRGRHLAHRADDLGYLCHSRLIVSFLQELDDLVLKRSDFQLVH